MQGGKLGMLIFSTVIHISRSCPVRDLQGRPKVHADFFKNYLEKNTWLISAGRNNADVYDY